MSTCSQFKSCVNVNIIRKDQQIILLGWKIVQMEWIKRNYAPWLLASKFEEPGILEYGKLRVRVVTGVFLQLLLKQSCWNCVIFYQVNSNDPFLKNWEQIQFKMWKALTDHKTR